LPKFNGLPEITMYPAAKPESQTPALNWPDRALEAGSLWRQRILCGVLTLLLMASLASCAQVAASPTAQAPSPEFLVRRFWDAFNRAAWDELDTLVLPTYAHHTGGANLSLAQFKAGGAWVHHGLAPYELHIDELIVQNDIVAIRWTARGIHVASMFGETPAHREVTARGMHFHRIEGNRIAEDWEVIDMGAFQAELQKH
jgi:predicted ester cyclase